jgi:2-polyprenyl-3-methyl-5-hydroxy-6-metoxy-1,4-benzoquinol methylase
VRFFCQDASDDALTGTYDLVTIFEALHDMARPVEALRAARALLAKGGSVLVADERAGEHFTAPAEDPLDRLFYGFSVLHCLPVGRVDQPSAATGTVMRPHTLREYADAAGFSRAEVLPIEHDVWRFYRLIP